MAVRVAGAGHPQQAGQAGQASQAGQAAHHGQTLPRRAPKRRDTITEFQVIAINLTKGTFILYF